MCSSFLSDVIQLSCWTFESAGPCKCLSFEEVADYILQEWRNRTGQVSWVRLDYFLFANHLLESWVTTSQNTDISIRRPLTCAPRFNSEPLDQRLFGFLFLFWTVLRVTANWLSSLEEYLQNQQWLEKSKRPVVPNRHGESERVCVLCVKYSPQKRCRCCTRLLKSIACFILSHTQISHI